MGWFGGGWSDRLLHLESVGGENHESAAVDLKMNPIPSLHLSLRLNLALNLDPDLNLDLNLVPGRRSAESESES